MKAAREKNGSLLHNVCCSVLLKMFAWQKMMFIWIILFVTWPILRTNNQTTFTQPNDKASAACASQSYHPSPVLQSDAVIRSYTFHCWNCDVRPFWGSGCCTGIIQSKKQEPYPTWRKHYSCSTLYQAWWKNRWYFHHFSIIKVSDCKAVMEV